MGEATTTSKPPATDLRALADKWHQRNSIIAVGHYKAAAYFSGRHMLLSGMAAVLAAIVGTTVFATLQQQTALWIQIITGLMSVTAAVLATLSASLGYQDKAEKHRIAGSKYNAVGRELEQVLSMPAIDPESMKNIRLRLDALAQELPHIPRAVHAKMPKFQNVDEWDGK